jgi:predicted transglutaminase-like cysteine proteinase
MTGLISPPSFDATELNFPKSNGQAKHDSLLARSREPMPPLPPLNSQFKLANIRDDKVSTTETRGVTPAAFNTPVLAPVAFVRFCARYPEDCKRRSTEVDQAPVPLTKARLAELSKVNREVNLSIQPQENRGGVLAEQWLVAPGRGDCNDYAVTKRHELLARGWPSHSLLLAEVVVPSGEHHLVLVVRTRKNDLVLDSLNWNIRPVSQIEYQWVRAQQEENPKFWSTITMAWQ